MTGTKLKCDVIGAYYPFWWGITSGGPSKEHAFNTALVELNAATAEVFIKDTSETVLGSAGHALELKVTRHPATEKLSIVLIEENQECYTHLKNVIRRRWPSVSINEAEGATESNSSKVYLFNLGLESGLEAIDSLELGNTIFFFDPLRSVPWTAIETVAQKRMLLKGLYPTRTEFLIFLFTSDWFLGRDDFAALPKNPNEGQWTEEEIQSVLEGDALFGSNDWRTQILRQAPLEVGEQMLVNLYKRRLQRWFRYVLPLPFEPKPGQLFHLILCSNFEVGVRTTREHYTSLTGNPKLPPDNKVAYTKFARLHPETLRTLATKKQRPVEWRVLWTIIKEHEDGRCDWSCPDLIKIQHHIKLQHTLDWLASQGYLKSFSQDIPWKLGDFIKLYELNWDVVKTKLGIKPPPPLVPLTAAMQSTTNNTRN